MSLSIPFHPPFVEPAGHTVVHKVPLSLVFLFVFEPHLRLADVGVQIPETRTV